MLLNILLQQILGLPPPERQISNQKSKKKLSKLALRIKLLWLIVSVARGVGVGCYWLLRKRNEMKRNE